MELYLILITLTMLAYNFCHHQVLAVMAALAASVLEIRA